MTATRRISRRRLRLLLERLQAPRPVWRSLAILPLILLIGLLGMRGSAAWFTSGQTAQGMASSGSWASLMEPDSYSGISFGGLIWDGYSGSLTVTSTAAVPLPFAATATAGGPKVVQSAKVINPGQTITITLSGTYSSDWNGSLELAIGANHYDWITVPVAIDAQPRQLSSLIHVETFGPVFCGKPGFSNLKLMNVSRPAGSRSIAVNVALSQSSPTPASHVTLANPASGTFATRTQFLGGTDIRVNQQEAEKNNPTTLTVTLTGAGNEVTGSLTYTFTLARYGDDGCGRPDCEPHQDDLSISTSGGGGSDPCRPCGSGSDSASISTSGGGGSDRCRPCSSGSDSASTSTRGDGGSDPCRPDCNGSDSSSISTNGGGGDPCRPDCNGSDGSSISTGGGGCESGSSSVPSESQSGSPPSPSLEQPGLTLPVRGEELAP